ncbi:hypothetical protein [Bacillus velezensis]|uniref:hypothetical protein n=1 Tax=Bacillus velezensis TaxID=492670 RepID=UPI0026EFA541|nr:hypothetical protein [Bacillus velezensis]
MCGSYRGYQWVLGSWMVAAGKEGGRGVMEDIICPTCGESELELWHMDIYECPECGAMIPGEVLEDAE